MSALTLTSLAEDYAVYIHYLNWFKHSLSAKYTRQLPIMCNSLKNTTIHNINFIDPQAPQLTPSLSFFVSHTDIHSYHLNISTAARKSDILDVINLIIRKTRCTREGKTFPNSIKCLSCSYIWLNSSWDHFRTSHVFQKSAMTTLSIFCKWSGSRLLNRFNCKEQFWVDWRCMVRPVQVSRIPPVSSRPLKSQKRCKRWI